MVLKDKKKMRWNQAVAYMKKGGKITRKHWLQYDYLYMKDDVIYCDGDYPYLIILPRSISLERG